MPSGESFPLIFRPLAGLRWFAAILLSAIKIGIADFYKQIFFKIIPLLAAMYCTLLHSTWTGCTVLHNHPPPPPPHGGWMEWGSWIGSDQLAGLPRGGSRRVMAAILGPGYAAGESKNWNFSYENCLPNFTPIFVKNPKGDIFVYNFMMVKSGGAWNVHLENNLF